MFRNVGLRPAEIWRCSVELPIRVGHGQRTINATQQAFARPETVPGLLVIRQGQRAYSSFAAAFQCPPTNPLRPSWQTLDASTEPTKIKHLAFSAWIRHAHTRSKRRRTGDALRNKSTATNGPRTPPVPSGSARKAELSPKLQPVKSSAERKDIPVVSTPLLERLPHLPHLHRPTKDELLAAATGAWSRFKIHFKWFSIKSERPFNTDDIGAFLSWIFLGHLIWFVVGTTTFLSLAIVTVNTVLAQGSLSKYVEFLQKLIEK